MLDTHEGVVHSPSHRELFFANLKSTLKTTGVTIDENKWNTDPQAYLGPNYDKIIGLIDMFAQYDSRDLYKILNNARDFKFDENAETKMLESNPVKLALQQVIGKNFVQALKDPNDKAYSSGLDSELIPYLDERLFPKAEMLAGKIGLEVYEGKVREGSISSKILFQPGNQSPLTMESLKPMPTPPSWAVTKAPVAVK